MMQRLSDSALRGPVLAAIKRAGLSRWPRLWQNLRVSRQTELEAIYPSHVVCAWMGNTKKVALDSYLVVTDDDFTKAARGGQEASGNAMNP